MIDPVAIEIGPVQVHWYGIIIATAVLLAAFLASRVARRVGEDPDQAWSMLLWVVIAGVVGARLYHVIHLWGYYSERPLEIVQIWNGGLGIPGAVIGGAIAIFIYGRLNGVHTARWLDIGAPALLLGQAIGRLGNFVNQELYGPPVELCGEGFPPCLPFGIQIDAAHRVPQWPVSAFPVETTQFVPLFAYEAVLNLIGLAVLLFVIRRFGHRLFAGDVILMYVMWYGAVRSLLEWYRVDNWTIFGVPTAVWIGVLAFVVAGAWLIVRHRLGKGAPLIRPADTEAATDAASGVASAQPPAQPPSEAPAG